MYKRRIAAVAIVIMIISVLLIATLPPTKSTRFVISGWTHPVDEYGQGFYVVAIEENNTGSFAPFDSVYYNESSTFELNHTPNTALRLKPQVLFNYTYHGLTHPTDFLIGKNRVRLNLTMTLLGEVVFSKQNLTYDFWSVYNDLWLYSYTEVLNVLIEAGNTYEVVLTYEIYML